MMHNSRAVVLGSLRYSDTAVIVRTFTELSGNRSFLVNIGKGRAAMANSALLQPLTLVTLGFRPDHVGLERASGMQRDTVLVSVPFDTVKTCIALFMAELFGRAVQQDQADPDLFNLLWSSVTELDQSRGSLAHFPHRFMLRLSANLGFCPSANGPGDVFDLLEGHFCQRLPAHVHHLSGDTARLLRALLTLNENDIPSGHQQVRNELLVGLVDHFRIHLHGMKELNAHLVLREVLR